MTLGKENLERPCPQCSIGELVESDICDDLKLPSYRCVNCDSYYNFNFVKGWELAHEKFYRHEWEQTFIEGKLYLKSRVQGK